MTRELRRDSAVEDGTRRWMVNGAGWKVRDSTAVGYGHRQVVDQLDCGGSLVVILEGKGGSEQTCPEGGFKTSLIHERSTDRAFVWHEQVLPIDGTSLVDRTSLFALPTATPSTSSRCEGASQSTLLWPEPRKPEGRGPGAVGSASASLITVRKALSGMKTMAMADRGRNSLTKLKLAAPLTVAYEKLSSRGLPHCLKALAIGLIAPPRYYRSGFTRVVSHLASQKREKKSQARSHATLSPHPA